MEGQEIRGLIEAYSQVYETPEVLNEEVVEEKTEQLDEVLTGFDGKPLKPIMPSGPSAIFTPPKPRPGMQGAIDRAVSQAQSDSNMAAARKFFGLKDKPKPPRAPVEKPKADTNTAAAKPTASAVVLAKKGGVEGKLDKATGKFTAGAFTDTEKSRYAARAPKTGPATGMLGKTSYEVRRATPVEFQAAQAERARQKAAGEDTSTVANAEKALQAAKSAGTAEKIYNAPKTETSGTGAYDQKNQGKIGENPLVKNAKLNTSDSGAYKQPAGSPPPSAAKPKPTGMLSPREKALQSSFDLFDLVKGHLLDEGYADSEEGAMVIMVNMSEAWRESILESHGVELDEAQRARENPEEYERSESRRQSKRERAMNDPHTGINSPAFAEFMRQQMGGKKKKS